MSEDCQARRGEGVEMSIGHFQEDLLDPQTPSADGYINRSAIDAGEGLHTARRRTSLPFHTNGLIHSQITITDHSHANYTPALSIEGSSSQQKETEKKKKVINLGQVPLLT